MRWARRLQPGGTHDNRIERTGHQTENQPNHLAAIFAERGANRVNGKPNACDHPQPQRTESRKHGKIKSKERPDGLNGREIDARDEQNRRTGDPRQHHRRDRHRAGEENVAQHPDWRARKADGHANCIRAEQRQQHDEQQPKQRERRVPLLPAQGFFLRAEHEWKRGQRQHARPHSEDPAEAELQKIDDRRFSRVRVLSKQAVQRVEEAIIKTEDERDRPAGHTGDAVSQCHAKSMNGC